MKAIYCDICGKEIRSDRPMTEVWDSKLFIDTDNNYIEDVCEGCFKWIYCIVNMMKKTGWRPDFHEKLESNSIFERDMAGYALENLEEHIRLKLF